ncbi:MAG: hypothetical protein ACRDHM_06290 [Actinomycetota bacterium]
MKTRFAAAVGLALGSVLATMPAEAQVDRQVILVMMPGVSYETALRDPLLRDLAGHGGIGLMTTSGEAQTPTQAAVSLGAGRSADGAPPGPVSFEAVGPGLTIDAGPFREAAGDAEIGLLATTLEKAGRPLAYMDLRGAQGEPAMLVAMDLRGRVPLAFLNTFPALSKLPPEFLGTETTRAVETVALLVSPDPGVISFALEATEAREVMVLVVATPPTEAMRDRGDTVTPLVLGRGAPDELLEGAAEPLGLTSDTTRREGVVSNVDVAPTVLDFLSVEVPEEMVGSPVLVSGVPPTGLHHRYLEWREVVTPVGQVVLGLAIASLVAGFVLVVAPWRLPTRVAGALAVTGLGSVALLVAFVPMSLLPTFAWPLVVGALIVGSVALVVLAHRLGGESATRPVAVVALAGLILVVVDVASGWRTGSTPLLGGSALDGERFFGLGNPYAGIVLSGAVLGATWLRLRWSVLLLAGTSAFAGLPFLGADVGGAITLAVAAALWYGMNRWGRLDRRTLALAAGAAAVAVAAVVVTHRLLPPGETHVSRALSEPGGVLGGIEIFWDRLVLNVRATSEVPSAWLAVLGLPFWLVVALRPPRPLRPVLEPGSGWQRAIVVLALSGMVGYVVNDTFGTASIAFLFLSAAVIYPALRGRAVTEPATRTAPAGG